MSWAWRRKRGSCWAMWCTTEPRETGTLFHSFCKSLWSAACCGIILQQLSIANGNVTTTRYTLSLTVRWKVPFKLYRLPQPVQQALKCASCFGSKLDATILSIVLDRSLNDVASTLHLAFNRRLLFQQPPNSSRDGWEFVHDAVQNAAYGLIPRNERGAFHLRIGRRLWQHFASSHQLNDYIFTIVGQLLLGQVLVTDRTEQLDMTRLCMRAAEQSVYQSSYQTAFYYLQRSIDLLDAASCWNEHYLLTLEIYNTAIEVAFCIGEFDEVYRMVDTLLLQARSFDDTLRSHTTKIFALGSTGLGKEAIQYALNVLAKLDIKFPKYPNIVWTIIKLHRVCRRLRKKSSESLLRLPLLRDERKLAAMQILSQVVFQSFLLQDAIAPLIGFRMVTLSLDDGICSTSCIGFVLLGACLCGPVNDIDEGFRLGKVGLDMYHMFNVDVWLPRLSFAYYGGIHTFKERLITSYEPLLLAKRVGIETGDLESAMLCGILYCGSQFETRPLAESETSYLVLRSQMMFYGQKRAFDVTKPTMQVIYNLLGKGNSPPTSVFGDFLNEQDMDEWHKSDAKIVVVVHAFTALLGYIFGDLQMAEEASRAIRSQIDHPFGALESAALVFLDGLLAVRLYRLHGKRSHMRLAIKRLKQLQRWARHEPHNFLCRQFLLEAEIVVARRDHSSANSKYVAAIAQAVDSGSLFLMALGNELAGKYHLSQKDEIKALPFRNEALRYYDLWGAKAKVAQLNDETDCYPTSK